MDNCSDAQIQDVRMRLITKVGEQTFEEEIDFNEKFMADLIVAIQNGKSPADALCLLADLGSDRVGRDPNVQIPVMNRIGPRR